MWLIAIILLSVVVVFYGTAYLPSKPAPQESHQALPDNSSAVNDTTLRLAETETSPGGQDMSSRMNQTDEQWRRQLTPQQFYVTRQQGTERPFSGQYWNHKESGVYRCVCCQTELFASKTKFDAGCGWPSFWAPTDQQKIQTREDHSLGTSRVEVRCTKCDAHLGHLFQDGPRPTGLRYCINSAALNFAANQELSGLDENHQLHPKPSPSEQGVDISGSRKATFGAGCFWGVEAAFRAVDGVVDTSVGFLGGTVENPTYHQVCSGRTGHAEVVEVLYNPAIISYEKLLEVFWDCHDPTTQDRQGVDIGSQYRSVIYFHDAEQEVAARKSRELLEKSGKFTRPLVTEITPASTFYKAEEYHQKYLEKRGQPSCSPKRGK